MKAFLRSVDDRLERIGLKQSATRRLSDAEQYWAEAGTDRWQCDSHWRGASAFESDDDWLSVGADHVELTRRLAPHALDPRPNALRILEWGAGGGANAVHFAPLADEFIAVEISAESLDECARQVASVCATPFQSVRAELDHPEGVVAEVDGCELFLCFYVLELVPSREYGLRLLRIAHRLLTPGGTAIVQVKYSTADKRTRSHVRRYRRNLSNMTTYAIDEFWIQAERCGFVPRTVALVPKNRLDERYAYFALVKPSGSDVAIAIRMFRPEQSGPRLIASVSGGDTGGAPRWGERSADDERSTACVSTAEAPLPSGHSRRLRHRQLRKRRDVGRSDAQPHEHRAGRRALCVL